MKQPAKVKVELMYRDASNYKTTFDHVIDLEEYPDFREYKCGYTINMGEYGTASERRFFNSQIHPYPYLPDNDHNILEILEIEPIKEIPEQEEKEYRVSWEIELSAKDAKHAAEIALEIMNDPDNTATVFKVQTGTQTERIDLG